MSINRDPEADELEERSQNRKINHFYRCRMQELAKLDCNLQITLAGEPGPELDQFLRVWPGEWKSPPHRCAGRSHPFETAFNGCKTGPMPQRKLRRRKRGSGISVIHRQREEKKRTALLRLFVAAGASL